MSQDVLKAISLSQIFRCESQPRKAFSKRSIEMLADSIVLSGQETPISVKDVGEDKYELIDGERRWRAFQVVRDRLKTDPVVMCVVKIVLSDADQFRKQIVANLHREDLCAVDEASAIAKLRETMSISEVAELIGKSDSYVNNYVKLNSLPDAVKELMSLERPKDVRLSTTAAIDIASSTRDNDVRTEMAREIVSKHLSLDDTRYVIKQRTGYGDYFGGRDSTRDPRDDYRMFKAFLGRTRSAVSKIRSTVDVGRMYSFLPDEVGARNQDSRILHNLIVETTAILHDLQKLQDEVNK